MLHSIVEHLLKRIIWRHPMTQTEAVFHIKTASHQDLVKGWNLSYADVLKTELFAIANHKQFL
ncbi:MAG: hypothetical protein V7L30_25530 [Nostoc sp.]|uniref:hypothetical protein n=1 Tax=Nostoc sp. TaxID=1180 RepID=UPI002FF5D024